MQNREKKKCVFFVCLCVCLFVCVCVCVCIEKTGLKKVRAYMCVCVYVCEFIGEKVQNRENRKKGKRKRRKMLTK